MMLMQINRICMCDATQKRTQQSIAVRRTGDSTFVALSEEQKRFASQFPQKRYPHLGIERRKTRPKDQSRKGPATPTAGSKP